MKTTQAFGELLSELQMKPLDEIDEMIRDGGDLANAIINCDAFPVLVEALGAVIDARR